jgi:hypothetical protein
MPKLGGGLERKRRSIVSTLAGIVLMVMTAGLLVAGAGAAQAHVPKVTASCAGLNVNLQGYQRGWHHWQKNTVKVVISGATVDEDDDFGTTYAKSFDFPQGGATSTYSVTVRAWDSHRYDVDASGSVGPCGKGIVQPLAPTVGQAVCTGPGTHSTPSVTLPTGPAGIAYSYDSNSHVVTATTDGSHELAATLPAGWNRVSDSLATFTVTLSSPGDCHVSVTPVKPTVTASRRCGHPGHFVIPSTTGVQYLLNGRLISAGKHTGPARGSITAVAEPGYRLSHSDWSFALSVAAARKCHAKPTIVVPVVRFHGPTCGHPHRFEVVGLHASAIEYVETGGLFAGGTVQVTATPKPGFAFPAGTVTHWSHTFNTVADCAPDVVLPTAVAAGEQGAPSPAAGSGLAPWLLVGGVALLGGLGLFLGATLTNMMRRRGTHQF